MQSKNISQQIAADPNHSVWVSASAGTGKTKVLTDRVLRLLLSGVAFEKILCLTFTNNAASEMTNRITNSLMEWERNPEIIEYILGTKPTKSQKQRATGLFRELMLSPEQLSIHTIHSFCQKTLQKFPFEAGTTPGFRVLSDIEAKELCEKLIDEIAESLNRNCEESRDASINNELLLSAPNDTSLNHLLSNTHESTFNEIIFEILTSQMAFRDLFHKYHSGIEYGNYLRKESKTEQTEEFYIQEFASSNIFTINISDKKLVQSEINLITAYNNYANLPLESRIKSFSKIKSLFCTAKGTLRKTLLNKNSREKYPELAAMLENIQMRVFDCDQKVNTARMIIATCHMFETAKYVIEKYIEHKKRLVCLDYDDLIYYTKELLTNNTVKDWVLYKLDGGIMHLLVDEAQDTSPKQWQIIEAIMREFYSGESSTKEDRTIFIVGDEKQSIYSFQGADVSNFNRVNNFIKNQMMKAQKQYKDIELDLAYRSTLPILQFVTEIFGSKYFPHNTLQCFRKEEVGLVELWPLYKDKIGPKDLFWPLVHEFETEQSADSLLAIDIAKFIKKYIDSGTILPSTGKPARPEDFMILIRRRNQFSHTIISSLKEYGVSVAGIDRMAIMQHLSAQDIVSVAKFILLPEDDLNLAELLKSPIIGIDDIELYNIASKPRIGSLYATIDNPDILQLLNYFREIGNLGAFNVLHYIIDIMGFRKILKIHNGEGSDDVLDELLSLVSNWSNKNNDSLQEFIYWLEKREIEIKREVASSSSVRVMTVHAAKGLESPIVILADTTSMPKRHGNFLWKNDNFLWLGSTQNANITYKAYKEELENKDYEEYLRLLYVAATRAEDHLIIVGSQTLEKENDGSWYGLAEAAINRLEYRQEDGVKKFGELVVKPSDRSLKEAGFIPAKNGTQKSINSITAFSGMTPTRNNTPSTDYSYVKSPLASRMDISYGTILHKILEDSVKTRNFTFEPSHPYVQALPAKLKEPVITKLSKLFLMEEFLNLTKYPSLKTEVSIGYMEDDKLRIGRIDLVAISDEEVIIIDYKTDSAPPLSALEVNYQYRMQLKFYADSMQKIMPYHKIRTKILWLENLEFMEIDLINA